MDSIRENSAASFLPRSTFAWTMQRGITPENQLLLDQITNQMGHTPHKILAEDSKNNFILYKITKRDGNQLYFYDTSSQECLPLTNNVLDGAHPYVHLETVSSDAIYWSYFPENNHKEKLFYEFSLQDRENKPFETPAPHFNINFSRDNTLHGIAFL